MSSGDLPMCALKQNLTKTQNVFIIIMEMRKMLRKMQVMTLKQINLQLER